MSYAATYEDKFGHKIFTHITALSVLDAVKRLPNERIIDQRYYVLTGIVKED